MEGLLLEFFAMFLLVWVYNALFCDIDAAGKMTGLGMGSVYLVGVCAFGLVSGGCVNLVNLFGPGILSGNTQDFGYYIAGQLFGGLSAGFIYQLFIVNKEDMHEDELKTKLPEKQNLVKAK